MLVIQLLLAFVAAGATAFAGAPTFANIPAIAGILLLFFCMVHLLLLLMLSTLLFLMFCSTWSPCCSLVLPWFYQIIKGSMNMTSGVFFADLFEDV